MVAYPKAADALFPLGKMVATQGALRELKQSEILLAIQRHVSGDWGDLVSEDSAANDESLKLGGRLFSAYHTSQGIKFYVITEADRSVTTVLLPSEY